MIATSTFVMFALMYLNTFELDDVFYSQTRAWMALVMGAAMAVVMLLFMIGMYEDKKIMYLRAGGNAARRASARDQISKRLAG